MRLTSVKVPKTPKLSKVEVRIKNPQPPKFPKFNRRAGKWT